MTIVQRLAADFRRWGKNRVRLVKKGVTKHGVIFDRWFNRHGTKG